jgi:hypothetical protein
VSTIVSPPRRTIAPALWAAPVAVTCPGRPARQGLTLAAALDLDACPGAVIVGHRGTVLARCTPDRPGVWQTTDAATVPA